MNESTKKHLDYRGVTAALRQTLLEKYNYSCAICGAKNEDVPLELAHVVPLQSGGQHSEHNLLVLCPNCHRNMDLQPREIEFVSFLFALLSNHPDYLSVVQEALFGHETRFRADLIAVRELRNRRETLVIECRTSRALSASSIHDLLARLEAYHRLSGSCQMVLAVPGTLHSSDLSALRDQGVEVWDLEYLASTFVDQIQSAPTGYYKSLFLSHLTRSTKKPRELELLDSLRTCSAGKKDWYVYQSLVGDILEVLFSPPLAKPIPGVSDKARANRRDFIVPNYAPQGFWSFMRDKYGADYVVVDAKNYGGKVKKDDVLQIANYLKLHGAGLFGMIVCRAGGDSAGCEHTLREQWLLHQKLILVLDDEDIERMLIAKVDGAAPEDVVSSKIEQFRLSM